DPTFTPLCLSLRAFSEWFSASRPCLFGVAQFRYGATIGRALSPAIGGYRRRAVQTRIFDRHSRRSCLARNHMGNSGTGSIGPLLRIRFDSRTTERPRTTVPVLLHAQFHCKGDRRT